MHQAYRPLPDGSARIVQYRVYQILGKLLLGLGLLIVVPITTAIIQYCGWFWAWLAVAPIALFVGLVWPGFPAFCRCPECNKRMTRSSKEGKVLRKGTYFNEIEPSRHYLVCHRCKFYVFLGESGH